jgi:hypothetical protein
MMRRVTQLVLVTLLLFSSGFRELHAQTTAQITGTITDTQNAVVGGAGVVVTSADTGIAHPTKTNALGVYTVSLLKPGPYRIDISATGFRSLSRTGVTLEVAQTATLDFKLQVGGNVETVSVSGDTPLLNVSSDAIGGVVEPAQVENLPMLGRNSNALMVLEPGVVSTSKQQTILYSRVTINSFP